MSVKEQIVAEYLCGAASYHSLAARYGFGATSIHRWVSEHRLRHSIAAPPLSPLPPMQTGEAPPPPAAVVLPPMQLTEKSQEELQKEVALLQAQLQQERLQVKLLNAIIDIAEQELAVPIRKKAGTRQSKK